LLGWLKKPVELIAHQAKHTLVNDGLLPPDFALRVQTDLAVCFPG
jgi:hypothetical protein